MADPKGAFSVLLAITPKIFCLVHHKPYTLETFYAGLRVIVAWNPSIKVFNRRKYDVAVILHQAGWLLPVGEQKYLMRPLLTISKIRPWRTSRQTRKLSFVRRSF